jgi:hypothetical protein
MGSANSWVERHPLAVNVLLWVLAAALTLGTFLYQDKTGPTQPIEREFSTSKGTLHTKFLRSENIGTDLAVMFTAPVPDGVTAKVKYRRYTTNDPWTTVDMKPLSVTVSRRGETEQVKGLGVLLPSLQERAGKYEYFVLISDGTGDPVSFTGEKPIYARYKGAVPTPVLIVHILVIFVSMTFGIRTVFESLRKGGNYVWMIWATLISLLIGAFVLGPLVQWYAFRVWWSGVPFGFDWTDNKVLVELVFWVFALAMNWGKRRAPWAVWLAGAVMLVVYFIPHSVFGSEYNYSTGTGRGTSG